MLNLNNLLAILEKQAPLALSEKMIVSGEYDNSGVIVRFHDEVKKILFALDLSELTVKTAKKKGCDTIVTHHPAIYYPVKTLSVNDQTSSPVLLAAREGLNVISMHLNLDVADRGIDYYLMKCLGGESYKILDYLDETHGYGREFSVGKVAFSEYVGTVKRTFNTKKTVTYGKKTAVIKKVASFCGAGASHALNVVKKGLTDADLIVTSDMPHHVIKELTEAGKNILILPHYVSEIYGFQRFYEHAANDLKDLADSVFFDDKRFK